MTNKDASGILKTEAISHLIPEVREALWMGASALEEEHCGDYISKRVVIDIVDGYSESRSNVEDVTQDIISDIMASPPVNLQPCEDAISRADAEELFRNARGELHKSAIRNEQNGHPIKDLPTRDLMLLNAEQMIHLLPPVTPKQRTGHWIRKTNDYGASSYMCSECGRWHPTHNHSLGFDYCNGCGAKMVEPQESEG